MKYSELPEYHEGAGIYAVFTQPAETKHAFLVITGFGEEKKSAYRNIVDVCRHCAENGIASLRFDLRGTGDSDFDFSKLGLSIWQDDIRNAYSILSGKVGEAKTSVIALRLGSLLAASANLDVAQLILVAPVLSGKQYLKEELMRKQLRAAISGLPRKSATDVEEDLKSSGSVDMDGIEMPSGLYAEISALQYNRFCNAQTQVSLVYFANKPETPPDVKRIGEQLASQPGFHNISEPPFWNTTDYAPVKQLNGLVKSLCVGAMEN